MSKRNTKWHSELKQSIMDDPEARAEYEAFKLQLDFAEKVKELRKEAHMTQTQIAKKLRTTKSAIARLEAVNETNKHSPSLKTLVKFANALGHKLEIHLKPSV